MVPGRLKLHGSCPPPPDVSGSEAGLTNQEFAGGARPGEEGRATASFASTLSGSSDRTDTWCRTSATPLSIFEAVGLAVQASQWSLDLR